MNFNQLKASQSENLAKAGEGEYCLLMKKTAKNNGTSANQKANEHVKIKKTIKPA